MPQPLSLYTVYVTVPPVPPGTKSLLMLAVSKSVPPTVIEPWFSDVLIVGVAWTVIGSSAQPLCVGSLFSSPEKTATQ